MYEFLCLGQQGGFLGAWSNQTHRLKHFTVLRFSEVWQEGEREQKTGVTRRHTERRANTEQTQEKGCWEVSPGRRGSCRTRGTEQESPGTTDGDTVSGLETSPTFPRGPKVAAHRVSPPQVPSEARWRTLQEDGGTGLLHGSAARRLNDSRLKLANDVVLKQT